MATPSAAARHRYTVCDPTRHYTCPRCGIESVVVRDVYTRALWERRALRCDCGYKAESVYVHRRCIPVSDAPGPELTPGQCG